MARRIRITSKSHTITMKQLLISYSRIDKGKSKFIQTWHKMNEINTNEINSKPRRTQGGKGLLSRTISVQNPQESMAKNPSPREERERTERERGVAPGEGQPHSVLDGWRTEERGKGEEYLRCPRRGPKYPRLNLDTKTPVGANPEICTRSHPTAEFLSSTRSLLRDAAMSMKIQFTVLGGLRNLGR